MRLLLLALADGLMTAIACRQAGGTDKKYVHFPHLLTGPGELYLDAWRVKGEDDWRWPNAWTPLEESDKPLTLANMLGFLRATTKSLLCWVAKFAE